MTNQYSIGDTDADRNYVDSEQLQPSVTDQSFRENTRMIVHASRNQLKTMGSIKQSVFSGS